VRCYGWYCINIAIWELKHKNATIQAPIGRKNPTWLVPFFIPVSSSKGQNTTIYTYAPSDSPPPFTRARLCPVPARWSPNLACFFYSTTMLTHLFPRTHLRSAHLRDPLVPLFFSWNNCIYFLADFIIFLRPFSKREVQCTKSKLCTSVELPSIKGAIPVAIFIKKIHLKFHYWPN
jgi:hypothetical protein